MDTEIKLKDILIELKTISKEERGYTFGAAGSYSRKQNNKESDIDIIIDGGFNKH